MIMASHTKDQEIVVKRVLSCKPHDYYEILDITKTASDGEIKKSYRKLAIKLHPDKNPHPRSSEAFKYLNKAWGVLSDPSKKRIYDQTGQDPESRFAGHSSGSDVNMGGMNFGGMHGMRGRAFESRAFEEDIFNLFFGGANRYNTGGPSFAFGNNGFTFTSFGGNGHPFFATNAAPGTRQRQRPQQDQAPDNFVGMFKQLLPLVLFLFIPILSALFSESSKPEYSFTPSAKFNSERQSSRFKVPYFVPNDFSTKSDKQKRSFDAKVERAYVEEKREGCSRERVRKNRLVEEAYGWFSTDEKKLKKAQKMPMPNCKALEDLNLI